MCHLKGWGELVGWSERSDAHPTTRKPSMHPASLSAPLDACVTRNAGMVGIAALTPPYESRRFDAFAGHHLPECPVSSYSRIANICGWINSMKSLACCDKYRPFRTTTP